MSATYLITGANRGLGKGLVTILLNRPNVTVIAAVRDLTHPTSKALEDLPKPDSSRLILIKIDSALDADAKQAAVELESDYEISTIDVLIANAAIATVMPTVASVSVADLKLHFAINAVAPVVLFQAFLPYLERSKNPKFINIGSGGGSISEIEKRNFPSAAYGTSKAALHYLTRKVHFEHPGIITFPIDPGWVKTDMGNAGAKMAGFDSAEITMEESCPAMAKLIDEATREETSGRFWNYEGKLLGW